VEKVDGKQGVAVFYPSPPQPHWWIEFPDRPDQYWKQLSGETRRNLRKNTNRLKHAVRSFTAVADVPELLEKAHRISRQSWQAKRLGLRVRNDSQEVRLWESIASLGALRSYVLEQDGQPLAFQLALQWKGCLVLEETGYDAAYRNCSPGSVLTFRILEDLIARDTPRLIDFGFGDAPYKGSLCNRQTLSGPVYLVRRSWRPMTVMWLGQIRSTLSQRLRAVFKALRVLSVVRRVYRR
jgi:CelD/BcsL family acetyltransferase involved in cellulose biosynthesis